MIYRNFRSILLVAIALFAGFAPAEIVHAQGGATQTLYFALPNLLQNEQQVVTVIDKPLTGQLDFDFANQILVLSQDADSDPIDYFFVTVSDADSDEVAHWEFFVDVLSQSYLFTATYLSIHIDQDGQHSLGIIEIEGEGDATSAQFHVTKVKFTGKAEHIAEVQAIWDSIVDKANETDGDGNLKYPDLHGIVDPIVNGSVVIIIKVVSGNKNVTVGNFDLGTIDIEDINEFPEDQVGINPPEIILHEVVEQWAKQTGTSDFWKAHALAIEAQTVYSGWTLVEPWTWPPANGPGGTLITTGVWEKDGVKKSVKVTAKNGAIIGVETKDVTLPSSGGGSGEGGSGEGGQQGSGNQGGSAPPVGGGF